MFCKNAPQWGSVEYWLNQYNDYKSNINNPDYSIMVEGIKKAGSFLEYNKTYMTDKEFNNVKSKLNLV